MQRNCDDERETFMRQRIPPSGFNPRSNMLFRYPRTLIGVANYDSNGVRFDFLTSLGQSLTFQVG